MSERQSLTESLAASGRGSVTQKRGDVDSRSVGLLDSWFIRASWSYKKNFLMRCLEHLDKEGLEQIVLLLGPPVKDYYYSLSGYTNNIDDIIPQDDNRQLDITALDHARDFDFVWLLSLPRQQCINILIGLTELSGSALRMQLYEKAFYLLKEFHDEEFESEKVEKAVRENYGLPEDVNKSSNEYQKYKVSLDKYNEFINRLKGKLKKRSSAETKNSSKQKNEKENVSDDFLDYIQILPSWINRQILSYLDKETLKTCQKVNPYWKNAVKELQQEREVREKLESIKEKLQPVGLETGKPIKAKNEKKKKSSEGKSAEDRKKGKLRKSECQELTDDEYIDSPERVDMINAFSKLKDRISFRKRHLLVWTCNEYTYNRVLAVGKRWLAFSRGPDIVLCNLLTFADSPGTIKNEGRVVAMAFHPENGQLISACTDSIIRRWEVWSRQEMHHFNFPLPKYLVANAKYYVVAGTSIIKVFHWELNACQWTEELDEPNMINTLTITQDDTIYISYFPENNIRRVCASNGTVLMEIPKSTASRITCVYHCEFYCVTSSEEGIVSLWKSDESEPQILARRNFKSKINNVILHEGCIMAGGDNGDFQIWDVATNDIIHSSTINEDAMAILDIHLLNYFDHCKVILNGEMGIKILEFPYERKMTKKKGFSTPQTSRAIPLGVTSDKLIILRGRKKESKMKEQAVKRQSCHPDLRKDLGKILTIKESSEHRLRQNIGDLHYFPSIFGEPVKQPKKVQPSMTKDESIVQNQRAEGKQQVPLKYLLPIHNPYKQGFQFK